VSSNSGTKVDTGGTGLEIEIAPDRLSKFVLSSLKDSEHIIKAKYIFFFSFPEINSGHG
jgi:hypothetical protein